MHSRMVRSAAWQKRASKVIWESDEGGGGGVASVGLPVFEFQTMYLLSLRSFLISGCLEAR